MSKPSAAKAIADHISGTKTSTGIGTALLIAAVPVLNVDPSPNTPFPWGAGLLAMLGVILILKPRGGS